MAGEAAVGDLLASVRRREGATSPAGVVVEVNEEDILHGTRAGDECAVTASCRKGPGLEGIVVSARVCEGAGGALISTGDKYRTQSSKGAVGRAQANKGALGKALDTEGAMVSLRVTQGAVGEAKFARGNAIARKCTT